MPLKHYNNSDTNINTKVLGKESSISCSIDISKLTDEEFNEELNKGYKQAKAGKTKSAQSVFDNITKD
jgi:hypothetical protein